LVSCKCLGASRYGREFYRLPDFQAGSHRFSATETVFLLGLAIPAISLTGAMLVRLDGAGKKPIDWRILGGGLLFGASVLVIGLTSVPLGQELIFTISLTVIALMLARIAGDLDETHGKRIFYSALVIFLYRASPGVGEAYRWFTIDVLGFDEAFYGTLAQIGAGLSLAGAWLFSDVITRKPIAKVLLWLTIIGTILSLPTIALALRADQWTESAFGFGARTIALVDTTAASPFAELSMIPALTLVAINAPAGRRATWFALMASLMNVALVAGQLQTKYLNYLFEVGRGSYANLPELTLAAVALGFIVPVAGILAFGKRAI
jgi:BT1 family